MTVNAIYYRHLLNEVSAQSFKEHKLRMLNKLEHYLTTTECRRRLILRIFLTLMLLIIDTKQTGREAMAVNLRIIFPSQSGMQLISANI